MGSEGKFVDCNIGVLYSKFKMTAILRNNIQCDNFQRRLCDLYLNDLAVLEYFGLYLVFFLSFALSENLFHRVLVLLIFSTCILFAAFLLPFGNVELEMQDLLRLLILFLVVFFFRITFCHLPFQSKWLYVGTERGNIHIVNVESFTLSGYVIMWNKAIEL